MAELEHQPGSTNLGVFDSRAPTSLYQPGCDPLTCQSSGFICIISLSRVMPALFTCTGWCGMTGSSGQAACAVCA